MAVARDVSLSQNNEIERLPECIGFAQVKKIIVIMFKATIGILVGQDLADRFFQRLAQHLDSCHCITFSQRQ